MWFHVKISSNFQQIYMISVSGHFAYPSFSKFRQTDAGTLLRPLRRFAWCDLTKKNSSNFQQINMISVFGHFVCPLFSKCVKLLQRRFPWCDLTKKISSKLSADLYDFRFRSFCVFFIFKIPSNCCRDITSSSEEDAAVFWREKSCIFARAPEVDSRAQCISR